MNRPRRYLTFRIDLDVLRRGLWIGLIAALVAAPTFLIARTVVWPESTVPFQAGTTISSSQVNAALLELKAAIDDNHDRLVLAEAPQNPELLYVGENPTLDIDAGGTGVEYFNYTITGGVADGQIFHYEAVASEMKSNGGGTTLYFEVYVNGAKLGETDVNGSSGSEIFYPEIRCTIKRTAADTQTLYFAVNANHDSSQAAGNTTYTASVTDGADFEVSLRMRSATSASLTIPLQTFERFTL